MTIKSSYVERMMHVRSVEARSPSVGLVWKFEEVLVGFPMLSSSLEHDSKLR
ncbi:hypothetical protein TNCV_463361, partial [Trichonephila clavipes]